MNNHPGMKKSKISKHRYPVQCPVCGQRLLDWDGKVVVSPQVENDQDETDRHFAIKCHRCKKEITF